MRNSDRISEIVESTSDLRVDELDELIAQLARAREERFGRKWEIGYVGDND